MEKSRTRRSFLLLAVALAVSHPARAAGLPEKCSQLLESPFSASAGYLSLDRSTLVLGNSRAYRKWNRAVTRSLIGDASMAGDAYRTNPGLKARLPAWRDRLSRGNKAIFGKLLAVDADRETGGSVAEKFLEEIDALSERMQPDKANRLAKALAAADEEEVAGSELARFRDTPEWRWAAYTAIALYLRSRGYRLASHLRIQQETYLQSLIADGVVGFEVPPDFLSRHPDAPQAHSAVVHPLAIAILDRAWKEEGFGDFKPVYQKMVNPGFDGDNFRIIMISGLRAYNIWMGKMDPRRDQLLYMFYFPFIEKNELATVLALKLDLFIP